MDYGPSTIDQLSDPKWIYHTDVNNKYRFALGQKGQKTLACFGINPSTAAPGKLDGTTQSVQRIAAHNGYDGWLMLNIYPQRATKPENIHRRKNNAAIQQNRQVIQDLVDQLNITAIWLAWGDLIDSRTYFQACWQDVYKDLSGKKLTWLSVGQPTKKGHPRHPLYKRKDSLLNDIDIEHYNEHIGVRMC